jgi:hypothetical protein
MASAVTLFQIAIGWTISHWSSPLDWCCIDAGCVINLGSTEAIAPSTWGPAATAAKTIAATTKASASVKTATVAGHHQGGTGQPTCKQNRNPECPATVHLHLETDNE